MNIESFSMPDFENQDSGFALISGMGSRSLCKRIGHLLHHIPGRCVVERFPDSEVNIRLEESVRGKQVFIIQSTCPPVDEHLVQLLALVDASRRAGAARVIVVAPYFGYARSDKRGGERRPVMGRLAATLMEAAGMDHLLTLDAHSPHLEGFFQKPVDALSTVPLFFEVMRREWRAGTVVVSPDAGRMKVAAELARCLHAPVVVLSKERLGPEAVRVTRVDGDVRDRHCVIFDDMISTGGTIAEAVVALLREGAKPDIIVAATHAVFCGNIGERLHHPAIREVIVSDSIPVARPEWRQLRIVSVALLLAAAIRRLVAGKSLASLYLRVPEAAEAGPVTARAGSEAVVGAMREQSG
jgi:ribose-phosphate pyrophosphokinase